jgi:hypothetical protein
MRMKRQNIFGLFLFWAFLAVPVAAWFMPRGLEADEVLTDDGQKFDGTILEEGRDSVLVGLKDGVQVRIQKSEVAYIQRGDGGEKESPRDYPVLGITYGTPAVVNLSAGYAFSGFDARVSGGYWSGVRGIQWNLAAKVAESRPFLAEFSLVGGAVHTSGATNGYSLWSSGAWNGIDWVYGGVGFDFNYDGFTFEVDAVTGGFPNPVAFPFQVGFAHRFQ